MPPEEVEATLLIQSEEPEKLAGEIARFANIGSFRVQEQPSLRIHDRYFDTTDSHLQRQRLSLRFRRIDGESKLTLKGEGEETEWGALRRTEIELPWSLAALAEVLAQVKGFEAADTASLSELQPVAALQKAGLTLIQDRETHRTVRNVVDSQDNVLAELAIDRVFYTFEGKQILHYEIEVEAKGGHVEAVREMVASLKAFDAAKLRPWAYSKLATGKAIEALLTSERFDLRGRTLSSQLYEKVEYYLRRRE